MIRPLTFLVVLGLLAGSATARQEKPAPAPQANPETSAKLLREKLSRPVTLDGGFDPNTPLKDALEKLADRYGIPILVDQTAFRLEGIESVEDQPIRLPRMTGVRLSTVLRMLLSQVQASYLVRSDHVLVTTAKRTRPADWNSLERHLPIIVDTEFHQIALNDALRHVADVSGISVVLDSRAGEQAKTAVTAILVNSPVDTAVALLANMAGLKSVAIDNVLYVTTIKNAEVLRAELERRKAKDLGEDVALPQLGGVRVGH